jgi:hypothetical protein
MTVLVKRLDRWFYLAMALLIAAVVVYGFSHTIDETLIHPAYPRPPILWLHAAVFFGWVILYVVQATLIRSRSIGLHRRLGWFGAGLGAVIPVLGLTTAITMAKFNTALGSLDSESFLVIAFSDMTSFAVPFGLAVLWRKEAERHRRLMLIASCALTAAAFTRFPPALLPDPWFYAGVDGLIGLGVIRDLIVIRRVHPVYLWALPLLLVIQVGAVAIYRQSPNAWLAIADWLIR